MATFKVGDRVRVAHLIGPDDRLGIKVGDEFVISEFLGGNEREIMGHPRSVGPGGYMTHGQLELATGKTSTGGKNPTPPKFILQYLLDEDPFELFTTKKELLKRIKELSDNPSLKKDSIKVHHIAKTEEVVIGVKVSFRKI